MRCVIGGWRRSFLERTKRNSAIALNSRVQYRSQYKVDRFYSGGSCVAARSVRGCKKGTRLKPQTGPDRFLLTESDLEELICQIASRNEVAMAELHQVTKCKLYGLVRQFIDNPWNAEEVMQDVYRHIWIHASDYNRSRGTPAAWFSVIARSRSIDNLRMHRNNVFTLELLDGIRFSTVGDPEADYNDNLRVYLVKRAIAELPGGQQQVIQLAFFEGCSHTEIARRTRLPLGTVKTRIRTALTSMREVLRSPGEDTPRTSTRRRT